MEHAERVVGALREGEGDDDGEGRAPSVSGGALSIAPARGEAAGADDARGGRASEKQLQLERRALAKVGRRLLPLVGGGAFPHARTRALARSRTRSLTNSLARLLAQSLARSLAQCPSASR